MAGVVRFHTLGGPEVLQIEQLDVGQPKTGEMRIRVEAIGLNRAETVFRRGKYLEPTRLPARLGYEASGIIESLGRDVMGFEIGEPVCVIPAFSMNDYGVYAEQAIVPASAVVKRPKGLTPVQAAAVWMPYLTAYGALIDLGELGPDDPVLITAAASSVGLAAIHLARSVGAIPICTTRTPAKAAALREAGAAHVIVTDGQADLVNEVLRVTGQRGVRLVFDPVAGPGVEQLARLTQEGGAIFIYGGLSGEPTPFPRGTAMTRAISLRGYTLFELTNGDRRHLMRAVDAIRQGLASGALKPTVDRTFAFEQIVDAHRYLESNQQVGKIVVTVP